MTSIADTASLTDTQVTGAHFGRAATSYDAHAGVQLACARSLLEMAPTDLIADTAVDLGCATAPLAREQQTRWPGSRWLGVDLSTAMLQQARERGRTSQRFQPLCADAERLPLATSSQALVYSSFALQWCTPTRVAKEVARVLMPGGRLLLAVPLGGSLREWSSSWAAADRRGHFNALPMEDDWRQALTGAGLMSLQWRRLGFTEHYPDVKQLVRAFRATGVGHVRDRTSGLVGKSAWRAMEQAYEKYRQPQGLPLTWQVLFAEAEGMVGKTE